MIKRLRAYMAHIFIAFIFVTNAQTYASTESQPERVALHSVFSEIETMIIALAQENVTTHNIYGLMHSEVQLAKPVPEAYKVRLQMNQQAVSNAFQSIFSSKTIFVSEKSNSLTKNQVLENLYQQLHETYEKYTKIRSDIDAALTTTNENHALSKRRILRATTGLQDSLSALQRHLLFSIPLSNTTSVFHLRINLLQMYQYRMRELAYLGYAVASGEPISNLVKGLNDRSRGQSRQAWENVQSILKADILNQAIDGKIENIETIFFDAYAESLFEAYDLSDMAMDEADDPDEVIVDYERTSQEWTDVTEQANVPVLDLLKSAEEATLQLIKISETQTGETLAQYKDIALLTLIVLLVLLLIRAHRQKTVAVAQVNPQSIKQEIDTLVKEMNSLSSKVNNLSKKHG